MKFIGLDNYDNVNCYFITVLQILHSSETLTQAIKDHLFDTVRQELPTLMEPLCLYAEMNGNDSDISENIKKAIGVHEPQTKSGYNWISLLNFYYFPIIYNVLGMETFHKILEEMSIEKRMIFTDIKLEDKDILPNNELKILTDKYLGNYKRNIERIVNTYNPKEFRYIITALEMYINDNYGHVAPIFNEKGILYIYDDHNKDTIYDHFIRNRKKLSTKLRLYYFDDNLINLYNKNLHVDDNNNEDRFMINNYSYVFRDFDKYVEKYAQGKNNKVIYKQSGGSESIYKKLCVFLTILSSILIIVIIYVCIRLNCSYKPYADIEPNEMTDISTFFY